MEKRKINFNSLKNLDVGKWKPGQSGNPEGRPPKKECLTSLLREEIEKKCQSDKKGRTWKELIVLTTLELAIKGNSVALREIWDRIDGKLATPVGIADIEQLNECIDTLKEIFKDSENDNYNQSKEGIKSLPTVNYQ